MDSDPAVKSKPDRVRALLSGENRFAAIGFAFTAIFLMSMAASAWWAVRTQGTSLQQARSDQARALGAALARTSEILLANNELSAVRRILSETVQEGQLGRCRIVLPGGQTVADTTTSGITLRELPAKWEGSAAVPDAAGDPPTRVFPLTVPGRGNARLEVTAADEPSPAESWATQAGIGGICIGGLVTLIALHRQVRSGARGICAVSQALLARAGGQTAPEALEVNPEWGLEAKAWNTILGQLEKQRKEVVIEKTKELLQAQRSYTGHLASACDALSQGLILLDKNIRALYVNGAAAVLLQAKREEMLSADVATFIRDERVLAAARAATTGPMHRRTIVEVQGNDAGTSGLLRFIVRPVRREDWGVAMIIVEDITQQRVAEEARNAFVAQATHELRTPLTNIRLYAEMALDEGKEDPAVLANCLNVINQETFRLDRIVGDILSIAEIEAGTMTLKKDDVRLDEVFPELANDYAAQAKDKQIRLTFNLPPKLPVITGDRDKIRLALHNLLGNALKYTEAGGQVAVTVTADAARLVVDVADTGIGMSEEDALQIFEKFYRAKDPRVAGIKGSGLGLAIAREVMRLHGGDIAVKSELDKGSTFTLVLPLPAERS